MTDDFECIRIDERKKFTLRIDTRTFKALERVSKKDQRSKQTLAIQALRAYLRRRGEL